MQWRPPMGRNGHRLGDVPTGSGGGSRFRQRAAHDPCRGGTYLEVVTLVHGLLTKTGPLAGSAKAGRIACQHLR